MRRVTKTCKKRLFPVTHLGQTFASYWSQVERSGTTPA